MLFSTVIRCFENPVHTYPNDTSMANQLKLNEPFLVHSFTETDNKKF